MKKNHEISAFNKEKNRLLRNAFFTMFELFDYYMKIRRSTIIGLTVTFYTNHNEDYLIIIGQL